MRKGRCDRRTRETRIHAELAIDGTGTSRIVTGIGFLDHMLDQLARHGLMDLVLEVEGDLHIDAHHSTEDSGYAIGTALAQAMGERKGIRRFGSAYCPMDECLTRAAVDCSGRPFLDWRVTFTQSTLGDMDTELFKEFFRALSQAAGLTLHIENLHGENNHHIIESAFKATALALRAALEIDPRQEGRVPSTKGTLAGVGGLASGDGDREGGTA